MENKLTCMPFSIFFLLAFAIFPNFLWQNITIQNVHFGSVLSAVLLVLGVPVDTSFVCSDLTSLLFILSFKFGWPP